MSYGISAMGPALNQGFDMYRQDKRQDQHDEMARETHQARMRGMDQQYGIRADEHGMRQEKFGAWQQDRDMQAQAQELADSIGREVTRFETTGDPSGLFGIYNEKIPDGSRFIDWQKREDGTFDVTADNGQSTRMDPHEILAMARSLGGNPGAVMEYLQVIEAQKAEAQQAELEHQRKLDIEHTKGRYGLDRQMIGRMAPGSVGIGEDGGFTFQQGAGGMGMGGNPTALERNTQHYINVFGMDPQTATLAAQGRLRPDQARGEARKMAQRFIDPGDRRGARQFVRQNPEIAEEIGIGEDSEPVRALQSLEEYFVERFSSGATDFYGTGGQPGPAPGATAGRGQPVPAPGPGGGQHQPSQEAQSAAQEAVQAIQSGVRPEQIEQRLREVGFNENDIQWIMGNIR